MLKSTHKAAPLASLPPGWTEHQAPTGHTYFYNAETKESTYKRPGVQLPVHPGPEPSYSPYAAVPNLSDPRVANAYMAQFNQPPQAQRGGFGGGGRGGFEGRPRPQPVDKPRKKEAIPGCEPWILVYTKYSRRFVYNPVKNASYWRIPEKLMPAILEMDKKRILNRTADGDGDKETNDDQSKAEEKAEETKDVEKTPAEAPDYDSSEYEEIEVEVTDDEGEGREGDENDDEHPSKRQRTKVADEQDEGPLEFTEADIAAQLQAMGEDYGLEPGDYDDGNMEDWPKGAEGVEFSEEDAKFLFKDMLVDLNVNPYSSWDKLLEEGKMIEDPRYTALSTTKARKECWDEWTREKIAELKEQRAKQEKKDPKIAWMAFLQEKASPKLYWPEFKRKYRKEDPMKDMTLSDKDREKAYREHINRLKMPQTTLKSDLTALLKAQPVHVLNNKSLANGLPAQVITDVRYISLEPKIRDPLVEAYVQTLPPPPEDPASAAEDEEQRKAREARERREKALEERNRMVEEQRRRRERDVAVSKARLREEERELEVAMRVGKRGLQGQLASMKPQQQEGEGESSIGPLSHSMD